MAEFITRRAAASGLATLGAVVLRPRGGIADSAGVEAAARSEGSVTWYMAQADAETSEALGRAFSKEHPGISVSVIRTTGQVAFQRLLMDIKNHTPQCDVFSATDIAHMPILKERQELTPFTPDNAAGLMPAFKRVSDDGYYYVTNAGRYFLIYNNQKVTAEASPKAWTDLLLPQWKGRVATGHPAFSGCTGVWALSLKKLYGWEFFEKLAANNPRIGRSAADPITLLNAGECVVGVGAAGGAYPAQDKGNPIGINHPTDGLVLCVGPSAIPAHAPHPNAAKLFLDWLLSDSYSRLVARDGTEPLRAGVPPRPGQPPLASQKVIPLTVEEIRKGVPEVIEQWRDTFGS
ncbi:MAG: extracellular solute-binding protein [Acetobacteraceae bacterium]|jgi:iron(III) transport system substrate-binding protein